MHPANCIERVNAITDDECASIKDANGILETLGYTQYENSLKKANIITIQDVITTHHKNASKFLRLHDRLYDRSYLINVLALSELN